MRWPAKDYTEWHPHFTWVPTKVSGEWVWCERVLRRGAQRNVAGKIKRVWEWSYVNSELDLIKLHSERDCGKSEVTQGPLLSNQSIMSAAQQGLVSKQYVDKVLKDIA